MVILLTSSCYARETDTVSGPSSLPPTLSSATLNKLSARYTDLDNGISRRTATLLGDLQKKEAGLRRQVSRKDSARAALLFDSASANYQQWQKRLQSPITAANTGTLKEYIPRIDSMQNALNFLQQKNINLPAGQLQQIRDLGSQFQSLQGRLQQAADVRAFVQAREQQLKTQLSQYGLGKRLMGINQEVFYYQQQLAQYKQQLKDPDKYETAVLGAVRQSPAFQSYIQKNGYLARLFPASPNQGTPEAMGGLQKSEDIQKDLLNKWGKTALTPPAAGGGSPLDQQVRSAQAALSRLKDRVSAAGGGSSDMTLPDFTPNGQKLKTFLKRIEYGLNIQSQQGSSYLPATSNFALTLGYRLSDKATIGVGASYNMGWGSGFNDIHLSSQGISFRSFVDIKVKASFWLTGGWEYNYLQAFSGVSDIRNLDLWQKSALVGLMKKYKIGKQNSYVQLLYDLLAASETPRPSAFKFRVGYTF